MLTCQGFDVVTFNKVEESIAQYAANDSDVFCWPFDEILIYKFTHSYTPRLSEIQQINSPAEGDETTFHHRKEIG